MPMYREGDLVSVTLLSVKITEDGYSSGFRGVNSGVAYSSRYDKLENELFFDGYSVKVERDTGGISSRFSPRSGDVYEAEGKLWFVREMEGRNKTGTIVIENSDGTEYNDDRYNSRDEIKIFSGKSPKLVMRDGKRVSS